MKSATAIVLLLLQGLALFGQNIEIGFKSGQETNKPFDCFYLEEKIMGLKDTFCVFPEGKKIDYQSLNNELFILEPFGLNRRGWNYILYKLTFQENGVQKEILANFNSDQFNFLQHAEVSLDIHAIRIDYELQSFRYPDKSIKPGIKVPLGELETLANRFSDFQQLLLFWSYYLFIVPVYA